MANARDVYTGNGAQTDFTVSFPYIEQGDVFVTVAGDSTTAFTWIGPNTIRMTTAPAGGAVVVITRDSLANGRKVDYSPGSLTEQDLDTDSLQGFYAAQEAEDRVGLTIGVNSEDRWDAQSKRMVSLADPVSAQDASTKAYVDGIVGGVPAAQAAAEAARDAAQASQTAAAGSASAASTAQGAAETARDQAVAAANSLDLTPYATTVASQAYTDGAVSIFAAQLPGGLADRLRWLEVNLALNTVRDVIDAGWTTLAMVDGFADEFNDESGVDTGSSTGQTYDAAGDFYSGVGIQRDQNAISSSSPWNSITVISTQTAIPNNAVVLGFWWQSNVADSFSGKIFRADGGNTYTCVVNQVFSHSGGGWQYFQFTTPYTVPPTGSYYYGAHFDFAGALQTNNGASLNAALLAGDVTTSGTFTTSTNGNFPPIGVSVAQAMTLVSDPWTASAAPVAARAVLLVDPIDAITLNTDLIVEVSRDNGTTWTAGVLTYEADYDQNVQILATDEIDLTGQPSGTQVRLRVRTPTSKAVQVHAWTAQWR